MPRMAEPRKAFKDLGKLGKRLKGKKAVLEDFIPVFHALIDDIEARGTSIELYILVTCSYNALKALTLESLCFTATRPGC